MVGDNFTWPEESSCQFFPTETWKCDTILIFQRVTAALSLIGCSVVSFTIWLFRRYTSTPQRMVLLISVSGWWNALFSLIGVSSYPGICKLISFFVTLTDWTMLLWVVAVALQLYLAIFWRKKMGRFEWAYHYVIWPFAFIVSTLPLFANKYGNSGVWCWIVHDVGWRMGIWYVPLFVVIIVLFFLYISIIIKIRAITSTWERTYTPEVEASKELLKQEVRPLAGYPFIYFLLYIIPSANRIQNATHPREPIYGLVLVAAICATALGLINSLVYGLDKDIRRRLNKTDIRNAWYSHFGPKTKMGEYNTEVSLGDTESNPTASTEDTGTVVSNPGEKFEVEQKTNTCELQGADNFVSVNL